MQATATMPSARPLEQTGLYMPTSPQTSLASGAGSSSYGCHAVCWVFTRRRALHTALLHLKPLPKAICQTRSPCRTPLSVSMLARTYLRNIRFQNMDRHISHKLMHSQKAGPHQAGLSWACSVQMDHPT